ncbi:hypothetical protein KAFR_0G02870 [Kazachstania africana CBS 2517]|uniref:Maintenance of telomere capping protein 4 n=1 Tax=Kazachstania africana (strain ATCC 22294 / BCRC 22015 / CBS 2517 / CECT 1963 / NBRC 1671 / NRRL Y-8276) TaxID=1071382 RepID=H2AY69_KAZAF|nr:hypothetical protein KAFR_0G02870 [Kazachstania africana CBS 2517]CCF59319.1 hypothetical protein KAFR_0G02870 [Kazachstania africana CBS 2517]
MLPEENEERNVRTERSSKDQNTSNVDAGRVKLVTKLLLDSRYGLLDDLNYGRSVSGSLTDPNVHPNRNSYEPSGVTSINDEHNSKEALNIGPIKSNVGGKNHINLFTDNNEVQGNSHTESDTRFLSSKLAGVLSKQIAETKNAIQPLAVPKSTRLKAEKVKIYLDFYYTLIARCVSVGEEDIEHKGVEGVYNPLQTIRNRRLRKKTGYDLNTRKLSFYKTPIIAILQFSKSNPHRKKYKWFVDVNEKYGDITWRTSHWPDLLDPDGNLWFGASHEKKRKKKKSKHAVIPHHSTHRYHHHHHHRHENDKDDELSLNSESSKEVMKSNEEGMKHLKVYHSSKSSATSSDSQLERKHSNECSGTPFKNIHDHASSDDSNESTAKSNGKSRLDKIISKTAKRSKRWSSRSPNKTAENSVEPLNLNMGANKSGTAAGTDVYLNSTKYVTPTEAKHSRQRSNLLDDIPIQTIKQRHQQYSSDENNAEENGNSGTEGSMKGRYTGLDSSFIPPAHELSDYDIPIDPQLLKYWHDTRYIISTIAVMKHRRETHDIVKKKMLKLRNENTHINTDATDKNITETHAIINTYNKEMERVLKIGNDWTSKLLNDYSIRIESLISSSDRILSDINTTLTLKLKLFQENTERFNNLKVMKTPKLTKVVYRLLEFIIVGLLWWIWLVVSLLREIKHGLLLLIKLLKWTLW